MGVYHVHVQYMVWYPQSKRKHCKSKMTLLWKDHMSIFKVMVKVLLLATRQEKETASTAKMVGNGEFQSFFRCKDLELSSQLTVMHVFKAFILGSTGINLDVSLVGPGASPAALLLFCNTPPIQSPRRAPSSRLTQESLA